MSITMPGYENERARRADTPEAAPAKVPVTIAHGDGIGPEIMDACLFVLKEAGARLEFEEVAVGEKVYLAGNPSGVDPALWESIARTKVFLKAPLTTPQGGGFKSVNVTTRKALGLFANVRPAVSYSPFVTTHHPGMDVVIVRENEEDLYAGIEHRQTDEVYQCLKLITRPGTERICRYAFEYARAYGRRKVSCFTKDNIMKLTDGLFHRVFLEVARDYPEIQAEHWIVDIGAAKLAHSPRDFDVVVVPNLYGDILSDVTAQIAGSVGLAGSANIGEHAAMFEAIHGSAPRLAGRNVANPSGLLHAAIMMLVHLGQRDVAERIHNAWLATIEDGIHTEDIYRDGLSRERVGTREFAEAVVVRLGRQPRELRPAHYPAGVAVPVPHAERRPPARREMVGVDVFLAWDGEARDPRLLAELILPHAQDSLRLEMITNRGQKVWPNGFPSTFCTDHWRCRFSGKEGQPIEMGQVLRLLERFHAHGLDVIKTENLFTFDGERGFSLGQGQ